MINDPFREDTGGASEAFLGGSETVLALVGIEEDRQVVAGILSLDRGQLSVALYAAMMLLRVRVTSKP